MYEYLRVAGHGTRDARRAIRTPSATPGLKVDETTRVPRPASRVEPSVDRTPKLYIAGKQTRPDSGYSLPVHDSKGRLIAEIGRGNRKDIRNAVEAAHAASGWSRATAHLRAQVLYYIGENLSARSSEFAARLKTLSGGNGAKEVDAAIRRCFAYAAYADKYDGAVHHTPFRNVTLAMPEPIGVIGVAAPDELPLLSFLSVTLPAIAMGNRVVVIPSESGGLLATDLYQVFDTSDLPGGVINIVTGLRKELLTPLAGHDDVDAIWCFGDRAEATEAEKLSAGNMKRTWSEWTVRDWMNVEEGEGPEYLRQATQVKNIWVPYGA